MAITLNDTLLAAPTYSGGNVNLSGTTGGSLSEGDTVYVRVTACDSSSYVPKGYSVPSTEVSYTLAAGETAVVVDWDSVSGAGAYQVWAYVDTGGGAPSATDYYDKRCASGNTSSTTTSTTYTVTAQGNRPGWETWCVSDGNLDLPGSMAKETGVVILSPTGSGGWMDVYNAFDTAYGSDYCYDDGYTTMMKASIDLSGSETTTIDSSDDLRRNYYFFLRQTLTASGIDVTMGRENNDTPTYNCSFNIIGGDTLWYLGPGVTINNVQLGASTYVDAYVATNARGSWITLNTGTPTIRALSTDGYFDAYYGFSNITLSNCRMRALGDNMTIENMKLLIDTNSGTRSLYVIYYGTNNTYKNCTFEAASGLYHIYVAPGNYTDTIKFFDCTYTRGGVDQDYPTLSDNSTSGIDIQLRLYFNIHVRDRDDTDLTGVTVDLQYDDDSYVWTQGTKTTNASGVLASDEEVQYYIYDGSWSKKGPYKLTVSKAGYETVVIDDCDWSTSQTPEITLHKALIPSVGKGDLELYRVRNTSNNRRSIKKIV